MERWLTSNILRRFASSDMKWVVFDQPVDSIWIENLNSDIIDHLLVQIKLAFNKSFNQIIKQFKQSIPVHKTYMAVGLIKIFKMVIEYHNQQLNCNLRDDISKKNLEKLFDNII